MARILMLLYALSVFVMTNAQTFSFRFRSTPLPKAIHRIMEKYPEAEISYIYNELENYKTNATVNANNIYDALRQVIGLNPVTVLKVNNRYYVEALQRGDYVYSGRAVASDGCPVEAATVMLLSPKDSVVITYGITDANGRFSIPCDVKNVIGKLTCLGYKPELHRFDSFAVGDVQMQEMPESLNAITVNGDMALNYSDRNVYLPSMRQKKTATDAIDLLRRMAIPQIRIDLADNSVKATDGNPATIYINYVKASPDQLEGMRTADVRKVEFYNLPSDPRFMGEKNVINFIMQIYEFGGYTKLMLDESILTGLASKASVYSKFTYKKMTFDLYLGSRNFNNHHGGSTQSSSYLLSGKGESPHWVNRVQTPERSHYIENVIPLSVRAAYTSQNFQMENNVSFTLSEKPKDNISGTLNFTPEIVDSKAFESENKSNVKTVSYNGYFNFSFPRDYTLALYPYLSYSHNIKKLMYSNDSEEIINDAIENMTDLNMSAALQKKVSDNHRLTFYGFGGRTAFNIDYSGNYPAVDKIRESFGGGSLMYNFNKNKFDASFQAGVRYQSNRTNHLVYNLFYPYGNFYFGWSPDRKNSLNLSVSYVKENMPVNIKSPNVLQENELMYYCGNPDLKDSHMITANLSHNWNPLSWFRLSSFAQFMELVNRWTPFYSSYDGGNAIIRGYENNGHHIRTSVSVTATATLLDNSLQLQVSPYQFFFQTTGGSPTTYYPFLLFGSVQYYLRDFYFSCYFNSPLKSLWSNYDTIYRSKSQLQLGAGWSHSDFNLRLTISNPFRRSWVEATRELSYPMYSESQIHFGVKSHFKIELSAVYTFGYGKKVVRGNEVGEQAGVSSAILQ